jgi:hypothetical protein
MATSGVFALPAERRSSWVSGYPAPDAVAARPAQRVLVVTNETLAEANEVPDAIRPLLDAAEDIYVIAPTLTTWLQWS